MPRLISFLTGLSLGIISLLATAVLLLLYLPHFLVVDHEPVHTDAVIVLGGDADGSRLCRGGELVDAGWAPQLILTSDSQQRWLRRAQKTCPNVPFAEHDLLNLQGSSDTRLEAQLSLDYCRQNGLRQVLIVTSPYHSRRSAFVFSDVYAGSGIQPRVLSSGSFGRYRSPDSPWWRDQLTVEAVWNEFGKILYWELTPLMEWYWGRDAEGHKR